MTKYKVNICNYGGENRIKAVEIERESDKSVYFIDSRKHLVREGKKTKQHVYVDTPEEAKAVLGEFWQAVKARSKENLRSSKHGLADLG